MKVRYGFVSNSSSTSFCIYGTSIGRSKADELDGNSKELEICYGNPDYEDAPAYIGVSWKRIRDDETGAQFKARVEAEIKKILGDEIVECGTIEVCYYNG